MKRRTKLLIAVTPVMLIAFALYVLGFCPISEDILEHAVRHGPNWMVALQLDLGVKPEHDQMLHLAIMLDHPVAAKLLIDHGANIQRTMYCSEPHGPALFWALAYGRRDVAKHLLKHGARGDYEAHGYQDPNSALQMAVELNDPELVRLLLKNGAKPDGYLSDATPLQLAKAYKRQEIVRILLRAGATDGKPALQHTPEDRYCFYAGR